MLFAVDRQFSGLSETFSTSWKLANERPVICMNHLVLFKVLREGEALGTNLSLVLLVWIVSCLVPLQAMLVGKRFPSTRMISVIHI